MTSDIVAWAKEVPDYTGPRRMRRWSHYYEAVAVLTDKGYTVKAACDLIADRDSIPRPDAERFIRAARAYFAAARKKEAAA